jgi:hypothetical protein
VVNSYPTVGNPLKRYIFREIQLSDDHIKEVLEAAACLLPPEPAEGLGRLSDRWQRNVLEGRHALGLPKEWMGIESAVGYIRLLRSETLDPVRDIVASMFYMNYELLSIPKGKLAKTCVLNYIESADLGDPTSRLDGQILRNDITHTYSRKGGWCWRVVASLGAGVLFRDEWLRVMYEYRSVIVSAR